VLAGIKDNGVYVSENRGDSWTTYDNALTYKDIQALAVDDSQTVFAATYWNGVYRSRDKCKTWTPVNDGITDPYVSCLLVGKEGALYAGTNSAGIFRSSNGGDTWEPKNNQLPGTIIRALAIDENGVLYASVFMYGVYMSTDRGETWVKAGEGFTQPIEGFASNHAGHLFGGTVYGGVYVLTGPSATWQQYMEGLYIIDVKCLAMDVDGSILAGTWGAGIYRSKGSPETGIAVSPFNESVRTAIVQHHPNPFNAATTIVYTLPGESLVDLSIFDILGRKVLQLVQGRQSGGTHTVVWDASDIPSGTYFIALESGAVVRVSACTLIK
jgi:photosystem II stability/assembly factor-like uncharacterized protein